MVRVDGMTGTPVIDVVCGSDYDLAGFYRKEGFTVVNTVQRSAVPFWPTVSANCVGLVKAVLGMFSIFPITPFGLYTRLRGYSMLPGSSLFSPPKPKIEPLPPPPPPPPERTDPAVLEARKKKRIAARLRKGRSATILTGGAGVPETPALGRPVAGSDTLG